ncbi:MAG TPA: hypothetical protein VMA34_08480 [Terracidiphilus sp.]|nr:hypothetical protein [Terracidiphilus sp.]
MFMAAMSPVPGQTADNPAGSSGTVQKQPKQGNADSQAPVSAIPQSGARPAKPDAQKPSAENTSNSVTVSKLPTVSIGKDWADWSYWGFGGILVIVGGLQVWFLYGTLRAVETQGGHMERQTKILEESVAVAKASAKAANDQIEMVKDKERARLQIVPLALEPVIASEPCEIKIEFTNIGQTVAFSVRASGQASIAVPERFIKPEQGEYGDLAIQTLLKPFERSFSSVACYFPRKWEDAILYGDGKIAIVVSGQIRYDDVFDTGHIEEFSYRMDANGFEEMPDKRLRLKVSRDWFPYPPAPGIEF